MAFYSAVLFQTCFIRAQSLDSFNPVSSDVYGTAMQRDGKILVFGAFGSFAGQLQTALARCSAYGVIDTGFLPSLNTAVHSLAIQPDDKILVAGSFTSLAGGSRPGIGRLNANGTLDTTFNPVIIAPPEFGVNAQLKSVLVQTDGKVLTCGLYFLSPPNRGSTLYGVVYRFGTNGEPDRTYNGSGYINTSAPVDCMALQPDGKVLIGGEFTALGAGFGNHLGRLNTNGTPDATFNPGTDGLVLAIALQRDGKILIGGTFNTVAGQARTNLARLNQDGTLDGSFNPAVTGKSASVGCLAVQSDGLIWVGGRFTSVANQSQTNLARLNADGTMDPSFSASANGIVHGLSSQTDGKLIVAGQFNNLAGQTRTGMGRFNPTAAVTENLVADGGSISWERWGPSPELRRVTFESSSNLTTWRYLGDGMRNADQWQLGGVSIPANHRVRARGYASGGGLGSASWLVETLSGPIQIQSQPRSITNNASTKAEFSAQIMGSPPLQYQWFRSGIPLADGPNISGSTSPFLGFSNVFGADSGGYSMVVSNKFGSVTSSVARLSVVDPIINTTFHSSYPNIGSSLAADAVVTGSQPIRYQWSRDNIALVGATNAHLSLTNLQVSDDGYYSVTVSNAFGVVAAAQLNVQVNAALPDSLSPLVDDSVYAAAEQTNGGILIGGKFTNVNGMPHACVARINRDGSVDGAFNPGSNILGEVSALLTQEDGGILAGGGLYVTSGSNTYKFLVRLLPDGTWDTNFTNLLPDSAINTMAAQSDRKVLLGGEFLHLGAASRPYLGRLNSDGTLDNMFNPTLDAAVQSMGVQPDGKILIGGLFQKVNGISHPYMARLNPDGSLDSSFNLPYIGASVQCMALQQDGKILIGGSFTAVGFLRRNYLARLNADGSFDFYFDASASTYSYGGVSSLALQADGKVLVAGQYGGLSGESGQNLGRLQADASVDTTFNPPTAHYLYNPLTQVSILSDGSALVEGSFTSIGGIARTNIARLPPSTPTSENLSFDGSKVAWLRGGPAPEFWHVKVEASTNLADWICLGDAKPVHGGWGLGGLTAFTNTTFRIRGYVEGGYNSGSSWFIERDLAVDPNMPPRLDAASAHVSVKGDSFLFSFVGLIGQNVVVEKSVDLRNWVPISSTHLDHATSQFIDSTSAGSSGNYYRVRVK